MVCSTTGYKTFLVCCNVALLFVGVSLLILGIKMKETVATLLMDVPVISKTFKAVISTGFFVAVAAITGIAGSCYEVLALINVHLFFLTVIVFMEFALGVALVVIRSTVEEYIESPDCNKSCAATLDAVVLDYALPSSGLMMTIIMLEGMMMYSAMKLYFLIRYATPRISGIPERVDPNLRMLHVSTSQPLFPPSPHLGPRSSVSPRHSPRRHPRHPSSTVYSSKPPDYARVVEQLPPPSYFEVVPSSSPLMGTQSTSNRDRPPMYHYP